MKEWFYTWLGSVHMNRKLPYYLHGIGMLLVPRWVMRLRFRLMKWHFRHLSCDKQALIMDRVNYYCRLSEPTDLPDGMPTIGEMSFFKKDINSVYFFDTFEYLRYFPSHCHYRYEPGDVSWTLPVASITKSRPISSRAGVENSTLLNEDKVRHFVFINDPIPWDKKQDKAIFRGYVASKEREFFRKKSGSLNLHDRQRLLDLYGDHPMCDFRDTDRNSPNPDKWKATKPLSLYAHLDYKFIVSVEGNDVSSNLKWILSSNSLAVCPPLTCESWFMEGRLVGGYHYVEIKPDMSDLIEKLNYYIAHPEEAQAIINHAHVFVQQFRHKNRERMVSALTIEKYLKLTGQL